jgi:hypothetical protein
MARTHARIFCSIWNDPIFKALTVEAQRLYLLALSQPTISLCGVVAFTGKRWATFGSNAKEEDLHDTAAELENAGLVVVDLEQQELWVRTFVKHDGVLGNRKLVKGMWDALSTVQSPKITAAFHHKYGYPENENDAGIAHPEVEDHAESSPGTSSSSSSALTTSSSSSALESVVISREVEARLRRRRGEPIGNPRRWKEACANDVRDEWGAEGLAERVAGEHDRRLRERCSSCDANGMTELIPGTMTRCAHPDLEESA